MREDPLIAIVDDDTSMVEATISLVDTMGFRTEAFDSAEAFLGSETVDKARCLILDVQMPGIDGLQLHSHLERANRGIPTIFVTGLADDRIRARTLQAGAVACLRKPFSRDELLNCIQVALRRG